MDTPAAFYLMEVDRESDDLAGDALLSGHVRDRRIADSPYQPCPSPFDSTSSTETNLFFTVVFGFIALGLWRRFLRDQDKKEDEDV